MIYPSNFEQRVGFDKIRADIAERCSMMSARELILAENFSRSRREVEERLSLADEMRLLLQMESGVEIGAVNLILCSLPKNSTDSGLSSRPSLQCSFVQASAF